MAYAVSTPTVSAWIEQGWPIHAPEAVWHLAWAQHKHPAVMDSFQRVAYVRFVASRLWLLGQALPLY